MDSLLNNLGIFFRNAGINFNQLELDTSYMDNSFIEASIALIVDEFKNRKIDIQKIKDNIHYYLKKDNNGNLFLVIMCGKHTIVIGDNEINVPVFDNGEKFCFYDEKYLMDIILSMSHENEKRYGYEELIGDFTNRIIRIIFKKNKFSINEVYSLFRKMVVDVSFNSEKPIDKKVTFFGQITFAIKKYKNENFIRLYEYNSEGNAKLVCNLEFYDVEGKRFRRDQYVENLFYCMIYYSSSIIRKHIRSYFTNGYHVDILRDGKNKYSISMMKKDDPSSTIVFDVIELNSAGAAARKLLSSDISDEDNLYMISNDTSVAGSLMAIVNNHINGFSKCFSYCDPFISQCDRVLLVRKRKI